MWPLLVVEGEELVESSEPPAVLVVGLEKPLNLAVRLGSSNLTERMFDVMLVEIPLKLVVKTRSLILVGVDEL